MVTVNFTVSIDIDISLLWESSIKEALECEYSVCDILDYATDIEVTE